MTTEHRILLLGSNGQLGWVLKQTLTEFGDVTACGREECDLANVDTIRSVVRSLKPTIIVNAGAYTAVDKAETEKELAYAVNATAPGVLAEEAKALGARLIHFSTDYVYDGRKDGFYVETDATEPLSVYGRTKLAGDQAIEQVGGKYQIFRTSWVFGAHGRNFAKTILNLAATKRELKIIADQYGVPTSVNLLSDITLSILETDDAPSGVYHAVPAGETTWHGYAQFLVSEAEKAGMPLQALPDDVKPIATHEYPLLAVRPQNSRMDTKKLCTTFGLTMPDWREDVSELVQNLSQQAAA
ncbi:MAG: dTDP-4-dehydrorhamnose reductase [Bdellovibrionales bacterium]